MTSNTAVRSGAGIAALLLIPFVWWFTRIHDWVPEIFGVYSFKRFVFNLLVTAVLLAAAYLLMSSQPLRHRILNALMTSITALVCLAVLELPPLLSGFDYQKLFGTAAPGDAQHLSQGVNKPDPVLIHIHWPDSAFAGEVVGNLAQLGIPSPKKHNVEVSYDHNGFRNDQDYSSADIAVIGDSFIEAAIVPYENSLAQQLEKDLQVPTVNLGQIAYGLQQELEVLKRYALPLSPKVVVWALFGGNDLRDIPMYENMLAEFGRPPEVAPLEKRLFLRNLMVFISRSADRALRTEPSETALNRSGLFTMADGSQQRVYFGQTNPPVTEAQWQVTVDTLSEAARLTRDAGAEFIVLYISRKFRIYRGHLELAPGSEISTWEVNDLPDRLARWTAANDIGFINTVPRLEAQVAAGVHPYFIDDVHWNPLGHRLAADSVIAYLKERKIYPFDSDTMTVDTTRQQ